ncbi:TlpA family protein disulfide reductase [Nitratiruptor tergarcus]|uniref:AhpC/TSA family protein n=1 Tax=Nitratiruptor tergarcus DSM 16512 TaxID=1069081 RepID=A0A1W1WRZ5_9BACT|nr:TlpA disulfide reductase family protein [Nitratiruptor tergarcus]SMC08483.1 AhpC/TSA family protein [Nitratiruptor tergarcus DSM 16512]
MLKKLLFVMMFVGVLFGAQREVDKGFVLTTVDNQKIHIHIKKNGIEVKEYPGKVIILDFFGKRCPPCRMEMPILGDLQTKLKDKMQIIGLHVQEPLSKRDLQELYKRGINYPIVDYLPNKENQAFVGFIGQLTGWSGSIPYMLFFDPKGTYQGYHIGMANEESLKKFIEKLYNTSKKSTPKTESNTTKKASK